VRPRTSLSVVVDVLIRLALESAAADRDCLVELTALERQVRLGGDDADILGGKGRSCARPPQRLVARTA
jgi:hypothetical protein